MTIKLVPVKEEHCDLLFSWVNDEMVRKNSFNTEPITYQEHTRWFKNKLNSDRSFIFICYVGERPVGQIRVDVDNNTGLINYSVAREYRGHGYGTGVLKMITGVIKNRGIKIDRLVGRVKYDNIASQKAFQKAGYNCIKKRDYIEYYKEVNIKS